MFAKVHNYTKIGRRGPIKKCKKNAVLSKIFFIGLGPCFCMQGPRQLFTRKDGLVEDVVEAEERDEDLNWTRPREVNETKCLLKIWNVHRDEIHHIGFCIEMSN